MPYVTAELLERVEGAVDRTIQMALALPRDMAGRVIGGQVIRSSTGTGANLEEAQAVITRKEYICRISISLREARETLYWLRRIENNRLLPARRLIRLKPEWDEIVSILTVMQKKLRRST